MGRRDEGLRKEIEAAIWKAVRELGLPNGKEDWPYVSHIAKTHGFSEPIVAEVMRTLKHGPQPPKLSTPALSQPQLQGLREIAERRNTTSGAIIDEALALWGKTHGEDIPPRPPRTSRAGQTQRRYGGWDMERDAAGL